MLPEEKHLDSDTDGAGQPPVVAETEVPKKTEGTEEQVAPLTREELAAKLEQLSIRAKAAGLNPVRELGSVYVRRFMKVLDSLLDGLEEGTKPPAEEAPTKKEV